MIGVVKAGLLVLDGAIPHGALLQAQPEHAGKVRHTLFKGRHFLTEVNIADYIRQLSLERSRMASQIGESYLTALLKVASEEAARAIDREDTLGKD